MNCALQPIVKDPQRRATGRAKTLREPTRDPPLPAAAITDRLGNRGLQALMGIRGQPRPAVQAKLEVGRPDDPLEAEADAVAHALSEGCSGSCTMRAGLENDTSFTARRKATGPRTPSPTEATAATAGLAGPGQPLPERDRRPLEEKLAHDLGQVRIHTDVSAADTARSIGARAYTVGTDVGFAAGEYDPSSRRGRLLLAHEIVHVIQQAKASTRRVQKTGTEPDYRITGVYPGSAKIRDTVFFDYASAEIDPLREEEKLFSVLSQRPTGLNLHGFASEEGDEKANKRLVWRRLNAVKRILQHPPDIIHKKVRLRDVARQIGRHVPLRLIPRSTERKGEIDYRRWRAVKVQIVGTKPPDPSCEGLATVRECPAKFWASHLDAINLIDNTISRLSPPITERDLEVVQSLFGSTDSADIVDRLLSIRGHLASEVTPMPRFDPDLPERGLVCATRCHPECRAGAVAVATGQGEESNVVLCPSFFVTGGAAATLVHEASHGTPRMRSGGEGTEDIAYTHERLVTLLDRLGLENAGSFEALVLALNDRPYRLGLKTTDIDEGSFTPPTRYKEVRLVLAWVENWARATEADIGYAYSSMHSIIQGSETEFDDYDWVTVDSLDRRFSIASGPDEDPVERPIPQHKWRLAGVKDRYLTIQRIVRNAFRLGQAPTGMITYSREGGQPTLRFGKAFFDLSPSKRTEQLMRFILTRFMSDQVSSGLVEPYIWFANKTRTRRGQPP